MRIGIDVRALMEGKITGVQVYIINLLNALFALDRENQYVLFANSFGNVESRVRKFRFPNVEYRIFHYPNKIFNLFQKFFHYPKVDRLLGGVDLFFSPHWRVIALNRHTPLVITFHDLSFEVVPEFFTLWQRFVWHRFMGYRRAARAAAKLIAVSQSTKTDLENRYHVSPERITIIYPGVRLDQPPAKISNLPEKYFLCFGTFEPRKNLKTVITAYQEYVSAQDQPLPLVLAGSTGWEGHLDIPRSIRHLVTVIQNVNQGERTELYKRAFAFLFLSFYEGFGFPILEAASVGVPVISSFATSLQEIGGTFSILVNPFRPSQIARAMILLQGNQKLYEDLQSAGLKASSRYNWSDAAERTLGTFREVHAKS